MAQLDDFYADYATVAASQTKQSLGNAKQPASGNQFTNTGVLRSITIIPATTSPGIVEIYDGSSGSAIVIFAGGATSVADLKPFTVLLGGMRALNGPWLISTGANVSAVVCGRII